MKLFALLVVCLSIPALHAQRGASSYTFDIHGRPVEAARSVEIKTGSGTSKHQIVRNANGRPVTTESVEERVVSDSGGTRVVERVVRRTDPNGRQLPAERVRTEERKLPDGSTEAVTTVMEANASGNFQVVERSTAQTRKTADGTQTSITVERPTVNAGFEVASRVERASRNLGQGRTAENTTVSRRDVNGRLYEVARQDVQVSTAQDGRSVTENAAQYERSPDGSMQLMRQTVSRANRTADGSEERVIDVYDSQIPGRPVTPGGATRYLREQQVVQTTKTGNGALQTISVRTASAEGGRLGPLRKLEEVVCTGDCVTAQMPAPAPTPEAPPRTAGAKNAAPAK